MSRNLASQVFVLSAKKRLRDLPITTLKIDKSFVEEIDSNARSTALIKHVILLASELKIKTIAEGVENESQNHMLKL